MMGRRRVAALVFGQDATEVVGVQHCELSICEAKRRVVLGSVTVGDAR